MSEAIGETCEQCGHPSGPHRVIAPGNPLNGGIIICQDDDCPCFATLSVHQGQFETDVPCGFCGSTEHKPYRCSAIKSRADFDRWIAA